MLATYLERGISEFFNSIAIAIIFMPLLIGFKFILSKKDSITRLNTIGEFAWLVAVVTILSITGIIGGHFGTTSIMAGNPVINFNFLSEGLSTATILNIILFIPFGFLSTIVFKKIQNKWIYGVLIGLVFTSFIEFLQLFTGRLVQIDDIVMNTLGTYAGYILCRYLLKFKLLKKFKIITD